MLCSQHKRFSLLLSLTLVARAALSARVHGQQALQSSSRFTSWAGDTERFESSSSAALYKWRGTVVAGCAAPPTSCQDPSFEQHLECMYKAGNSGGPAAQELARLGRVAFGGELNDGRPKDAGHWSWLEAGDASGRTGGNVYSSAASPKAVVLDVHGGGWVSGTAKYVRQDDPRRAIADKLALAWVFLEYPLSPEARARSQELRAWEVLAAAAARFPGVPIALVGQSAGGGTVAEMLLDPPASAAVPEQRFCSGGEATSLAARIKLAVLQSPLLAGRPSQWAELPSWCSVSGGLSTTDTAKFWGAHSEEGTAPNKTPCPLSATDERVRGLPPLYVVSGASEILLSEAVRFARRAARLGVDARHVTVEG